MLNKDNLTRKAILKCQDTRNFDKEEFKKSACYIPISVGQPAHEGDKFKATLIAVESHFKACTIMVCDSLQRHNLRINSSESAEALHARANDLGDLWLARNLTFIQQLDIPYDIVRWDYWLSHPGYSQAKDFIEELYEIESTFRGAVERIAQTFLGHYQGNGMDTVDKETLLLSYSEEYLKEECAAMLLLMENDYHFEIYPSRRNEAMDYIHQNVISGLHPNLLRAIAIKFKNRSPHNVDRHIKAQRMIVSSLNEHVL